MKPNVLTKIMNVPTDQAGLKSGGGGGGSCPPLATLLALYL